MQSGDAQREGSRGEAAGGPPAARPGRRRRGGAGAVHRAAPTRGAGEAAGADQVQQAGAAGSLPRLQERESGGVPSPAPTAGLAFGGHRCPPPPQECPSGLVDEETFKLIYSQFFPQGGELGGDPQGLQGGCSHQEPQILLLVHARARASPAADAPTDASTYASFVFDAFDADGNGALCFQDFAVGLSVLLRGTVQQKLRWTFDLYDLNKDGCITKEVTGGRPRRQQGAGTAGDTPRGLRVAGTGAGGAQCPHLGVSCHPAPSVPSQEMLEMMKSIYSLMGRCTHPPLRDSAPAEHVDLFFQVRPSCLSHQPHPVPPAGAATAAGDSPAEPLLCPHRKWTGMETVW
ncbi:calsenilin isoform X1 [Dryobates pubescens]|uniref:calsenilin isoform X1 n=1 Tax=Dryobates pubescens TaxID=118200 RepID=UPI0023B8E28C|nr:calsenilin isoform X1 [Dryobates pubescens]